MERDRRVPNHVDERVVTRGIAFLAIDDTDPAITYVGQWKTIRLEHSFNSTVHCAKTAGAALQYNFTGSSISVFGHVDITSEFGTPVSTYTLDDSPSTTFTAPQTTESHSLSNVLFFSATNLTSGEHTLTVRRASIDGATYCFDFIQILPNDNSTIPYPSTTPSSNAMVTQSPNTADKNTDSKKRVIAGVVCGVFALLIMLLTIFFVTRRRRRYRGIQAISVFSEEIMDDPDTEGKLSTTRRPVISMFNEAILRANGSACSADTQATDPTYLQPQAIPSTDSTGGQSVFVSADGVGVLDNQRTSGDQVYDTDGGITLAGGPLNIAREKPGLLPPQYSSLPGHHHDSA